MLGQLPPPPLMPDSSLCPLGFLPPMGRRLMQWRGPYLYWKERRSLNYEEALLGRFEGWCLRRLDLASSYQHPAQNS